jgi:N-acetylneuraminic acid mutarotase
MAGDRTLPGPYQTQVPVYGTFQVPSAGNTPGARENPALWTDSAGNLWLFGGYYLVDTATATYYSYLNDLWEFNTTLNQWAWMAGSSTLPVCPITTFTCNQQGVYGSLGTPAAGNVPGGRHGAATWMDGSGNVWIFGGTGADSTGVVGELNDLWEFNPSTMLWAWMGGSSTLPTCEGGPGFCTASGVYGTEGQPAAGNIPSGRDGSVTWTDKQGNFWLFAGGPVNDLWQFSPSTKEWTWVSGNSTDSDSTSDFGIYGTLQVPAPGNVPGMRSGAVGWTDANGNLWLFGGEGEDSADWGVYLNDLWKFDPVTSEWTWMGGDSSLPYQIVGQAGYYGNLGQAAFGNNPGSRGSSAAWTDSKGNFWLFGGGGFDAFLDLGSLNDLWTYQPYIGGQTTVATPSFSPAPGAYPGAQSVTISDTTPGTTIYYLIGNQGPATQYTGPLTVSSLESIQAMASASGYANSVVAQATYIVDSPHCSPPMFNPGSSQPGSYYTHAISVYLSDATPGATMYYTTDGTTPTTQSAQYSGPITVSTTETIQAFAVAPGYSSSPTESASYAVNPAPSPTYNPPGGNYSTRQQVTISDSVAGATIYYTVDGSTPTTNSTQYSAPITVSTTETIIAIAAAPGYTTSFTSSASYIFPAPPNTWTWIRGDPFAIDPTGTYGSLGLGLAQNIPGGRTTAASWTDVNGNFWLFGGSGFDAIGNQGALNDLWEYKSGAPQIQDGQWVWMGGSSTLNSALSCTPQSTVVCTGQPGVYGTQGQPAAGNIPAGRMGAVTWVDGSGNLWLFGGVGGQLDIYAGSHGVETYFNDLWKFNPSTNQWTWISGGNTGNQFGVYGTMGSPGAANVPGGRFGAVGWLDRSGNLWMFGGDGIVNGYGSVGTNQIQWVLNDLWMFNPSTSQWTWMGGSNTFPCSVLNDGTVQCDPPAGVYGTLGTPAAANLPGARAYPTAWTDTTGNFWLFGGSGYDSQGNWGQPNDLWTYSPTTNQWAWMNGSNTVPCGFNQPADEDLCTNPPAIRGTLGMPASSNTPTGGPA